ncbi:MAG TPA: FtsW/RodA/SpoVE family cell cycle protein, partial [Flavobacteriales bacterium]|nr:FtsW/RodA/SpoVE family cell cycle protein [Flavobacteriales bacterium]
VMAVLLLLTLLLGSNINDASRWITIPIINQSFQTSDPAKVVLIVYLARVLGKNQGQEWSFRDVLLKLMAPVGLICGLILPANFSTAAVLFAVCLIIMFIGQVPMKHMVMVVGAAVGVFILLLILAKTTPGLLPRLDTWVGRIESFGVEDHDANYQVEHAKIAIASGGFLPNGPGSGTSRNFLPHPYSDMIYAFIIEEYGSILGGLGLLLLYLILLFRAVRIASNCAKPFGALAAIGLGLMLVMQAMINMAVAVNLVPVTGQPLPLVSMGGTSVWFTCLAIGIMLSVSRGAEESSPSAHEQHLHDQALRVMISGGGTGGHIFPAIAIANAVREREAAAQFLFVGAEGKMEMEKVPAAGYTIEGLPIRGFQRGSIVKNIGLPWRLLRSMLKARKLVREFKPHVAVGVGGYASGPL